MERKTHFYENDMFESLLNIIDKIAASIPAIHKYHYFWCPKKIHSDSLNGFRLYIHGGDVLSLFIDDNGDHNRIKFENNIFDYAKYINDDIFVEKLKKRTDTDINVTENDVESWFSVEDWNVIFKGYKARKYIERSNETYIAKMSEEHTNGQMLIIDMESSVRNCVSNNPKPDLVGIRNVNNEWILSFIEYKCTKKGTNAVTLEDHYNDMEKYCNDLAFERNAFYNTLFEQYVDAAISKLKQIKKWNCQKRPQIELSDKVKGEIVFLFSNIGQNGFTSQLVYNKVMHLSKKYMINDSVKFCLLGDVTDNGVQFIEPLNLEVFLKTPVFAECDKNQWKRIKN